MEIIINGKKYICFEAKEFFDELKKNGYEWDGKKVIADKLESKFHKDDWIVNNITKDVFLIKSINNGYCTLEDIKGNIISPCLPFESDFHLWTIQDAKDGDVLACGDKVTDCPFIFHNLTEELNPRSYCGVNTLHHFQDNDENGGFWCYSDEVRPATKEQRDFLFQKMKEEGYKWDVDAKKLIKITTPIPKFKFGDIIKHKPTGQINTIKYVCSDYYILDNNNALFFESQDMWELAASKVEVTPQDKVPTSLEVYHAVNNIKSLENKVSILADEIIALKERVKALEIQVIKDMSIPPLTKDPYKDPYLNPNKVTCDYADGESKTGLQVYKTPDKAGDNVTLEEMKG